MRRAKKIEVILEFLFFGIVVGITEDVLAIALTTGEPITWRIIGIVIVIAIPFAFLGEIVADNIDISKYIEKYLLNKEKDEIKNKRLF